MAYAKKNAADPSPSTTVKFEAEPFYFALTDRELLDDLLAVAQKLDAPTVLPQQYIKHGRYSTTVFRQRFGSWNAALERAALQPFALPRVTNDAMLRDIAAVAKMLGCDDLPRNDYVTHGKYAPTNIARRFGTWSAAKIAAGLTVAPVSPRNPSNEDLFDNFETLWRSLGRQPRSRDLFPPTSRFTLKTYHSHFGNFRKALALFIARQQQADQAKAPRETIQIPIPHKTPREVRAHLRYQVLKRDHFRCRVCGRSCATDPTVELQVDHIHPWSLGGETTLNNLQTLCQTCNAGKSNQ